MQWCRAIELHVDKLIKEEGFSFEGIEELEHDLSKMDRWLGEIKERDFCEAPERQETEKIVREAEARVAAFVRETYERLQDNHTEKPQL